MTKKVDIKNKKSKSTKEPTPQYKVEIFKNNRWCHVTWRKNELPAQVMAEVLCTSRKKTTRVIFEGKIIYLFMGGQKDEGTEPSRSSEGIRE
jgi:hypothetical protein